MIIMNKLMKLPLAVIIGALSLGVSGNAMAVAYSVSHQNITEGFIFFSNDNFVNFLPDGGIVSINAGGTTQSSTTANVGAISDGDSATAVRGAATPANANEICIGCTAPAVPFDSLVLNGTTGDYSHADAIVSAEQLDANSRFAAENIAESYLQSTNTAGADAGNSSATGFTLTFTVEGDGPVDMRFGFTDDVIMKAFTDALGTTSTAELQMAFTLTKTSGAGQGDFTWNPKGNAANDATNLATNNTIAGLTFNEILDPFSLNTKIVYTSPNCSGNVPCPGIYDPTTGDFTLRVNGLTAGAYNIDISMKEISKVSNVPEPETLVLLGLGLLGFGFKNRKSLNA